MKVRASRGGTLHSVQIAPSSDGTLVNSRMLIREVSTTKPTKPQTAAQQRVAALQSQLAQARDGVKRERLAKRQLALNQARVALNQP